VSEDILDVVNERDEVVGQNTLRWLDLFRNCHNLTA